MKDENKRDRTDEVNFVIKDETEREERKKDYTVESQQEQLEQENLKEEQKEEQINKYNETEYSERSVPNYHDNKYDNDRGKDEKRPRLSSYFLVALIAALIGGLVSAYIAPTYLYGNILPVPEYMSDSADKQEINITTGEEIGAVEAVAKKAMKSVVGITTIQTTRGFFFEPVRRQGLGSGVIVSSDGFIITNSHVIANGQAEEITVLFEDGTKKPGEVLWYSVVYDLAVVKVDATNLPVAELGDSDNLEVGELAVAIGNPLGLEFQRTVTSGVISGLNRTVTVENEEKIENLIQTDASINPGNSGGPLLNQEGEVIGINTAKIQGGEGLGLSIPINTVKPIVTKIIEDGEFKQVYLGISGMPIEQYEQAIGIDLKADKGIYIVEIVRDSPAHISGLMAGDVILSLDDKEVNTINELKKLLYNYNPGDEAVLKIQRNGENKEIKVQFTERSLR